MTELSYSVIVPAYQAKDVIGGCVQALVDQTVLRERYEIIVVDDGSTDETGRLAQESGADRVLRVPHNGPAAARNAGVDAARGEIVLFTDADCEPASDWIERMVAVFGQPEVMGAKGIYRTRQRSLVARFVQLEYESKYDLMRGHAAIDFVDTYSAAYRRRIFEGRSFDTAFPRASGEDIEFSYRLSGEGYRLVFVPEAVVYHHHVDTLLGYLRRKYYVGFWRVRMYQLHPEKVVSDSHTPQTLKMQIGLMGLLLPSLFAASIWSRFVTISGVLIGLFLLSAISFLSHGVRRDPPAGLAAFFLLFIRALGLGLGFAVGLLCHMMPILPDRPG